ncbi:uncharacterized protein ColSpa_02934 [Colletotrichum spaethianum]|uniref:Uncharacterized protein n=1 Tax=Colletotrichum spaethianum TaxID=700344 RepID=A0AA37LAI6_9PEZI|nr:uncharacterized protein ColSpa_02934 [Colletotrichum spaethianum]GKT42753.1 hypothetical protein ColSpa_02934 [Colletotrichum spaethianum]
MAADLPNPLATMADLDQTEICLLKEALAQAQARIKHLEELEDLDQTEIVLLQARIDELTKLVEFLQAENRRPGDERIHDGDETQQEHQNGGPLHLERTDVDAYSGPASPVENEGVNLELNDQEIDDAAKDGHLSVSDSGFEGYGSDGDSD